MSRDFFDHGGSQKTGIFVGDFAIWPKWADEEGALFMDKRLDFSKKTAMLFIDNC